MAARSGRLQTFKRGYLSRVRSERARDHSDYILSSLRGAKSDDDRWDIRHTLINELVRVGRLNDAEKLLIEDVKQDPNNPLPLMSLATHYQYSDRLQKAKSYIGRAVAAAKRTRTFGYNALGQQARVAIAARDWRLLAQTLKAMTAYRHRTGNTSRSTQKGREGSD
jgi:tetratricopeptide (TPR) repeat protein